MSSKLTILEKPRIMQPEILKQNNLIECSFKELETWSEIQHDLFNEIIAIFQHYEHKDGLFEELNRKIYIRRSTLEKNINIRRKSNKEIFELLKKMRDTSFTIKGIFAPDGYKKTAAMSFFNYVDVNEKAGKESYFVIEYSELFSMLCDRNYSLKYGNYCKLNILKVNSLNSKYAKALYELIEANSYKKQFTFNEEELKSLLRYDVKHHRFSTLLREIDKVYEAVNSHIKFTYKVYKETRTISFKIEK